MEVKIKREGGVFGDVITVIGLVGLLCLTIYCISAYMKEPQGVDAYVLVKEGTVTAQWGYQQLPMHNCAWCGRTVNMNRHHVIPQAANPSLRDVKSNLVVLCRDCHFVLGHRCNWKQYNPDVLYICTHFTNCIKSADTRKTVDDPKTDAEPVITEPVKQQPVEAIDCTPILHVTNDVPKEQRSALERILKWHPDMELTSTSNTTEGTKWVTTNNVPFQPSAAR